MIKIKDLQEPFQSMAIENLRNDPDKKTVIYLYSLDQILNTELVAAFYWHKSPQGHVFWSNINRENIKSLIQHLADSNNIKIKFL